MLTKEYLEKHNIKSVDTSMSDGTKCFVYVYFNDGHYIMFKIKDDFYDSKYLFDQIDKNVTYVEWVKKQEERAKKIKKLKRKTKYDIRRLFKRTKDCNY